MKSQLNKNLINIRKFFETIYYDETATKEEVYNFLHECTHFVFEQYGIDKNKYEINIRFVSPSVLGEDEARMCRDEKYENKFEVLLNKNNQSLKKPYRGGAKLL